jgi:hypothetical protein
MSILDATLREHERLNGIVAALDDSPAGVLDAALQEIGQPKSEPEPLRRPLIPPSPYPLDALGPVLSAAAKRIHEVVQAPAALCGQSVLAAAALAAQPHANVTNDGRTEPLSLYAVTIAESGERKTGIDRYALSPHQEHERLALDLYRQEMQQYELDREAFDAAKKGKIVGKEPDAIRAALGSLGAPPAEPLNPIMLVPSPTLEGIQKLYATGKPSLGLFHDDAGEFIGGHAMNKDNKMKTASGLSRLWDRGEFDRVRASDGAHKYFGRRLSLHLMIQPVIAETILSDDILTGQGLLARALLVWPTSTIGERSYVATDLQGDPAMQRYRCAVADLLEREPLLRAGTANELEPRHLTLTPEAKRAWIEVHDAVEADQKEGREFAGIRAWASKSASQVLRIAGVLTLIENPDAGTIQVETIGQAAVLANFYLREAARIVGTSSVPVDVRNAEALRDWCQETGVRHLHSAMALQRGPGRIRSKPAFDAAIRLLEGAGWATPVEGGRTIEGMHRRRVWTMWSDQ